jgi:acyl carrier protein
MEISDKIRSFLNANLPLYDDDFTLKDDDNIFELGFVDSSFAMQLVLFIEEDFQITITEDDLKISNFSSVDNMRSLITSKQKV